MLPSFPAPSYVSSPTSTPRTPRVRSNRLASPASTRCEETASPRASPIEHRVRAHPQESRSRNACKQEAGCRRCARARRCCASIGASAACPAAQLPACFCPACPARPYPVPSTPRVAWPVPRPKGNSRHGGQRDGCQVIHGSPPKMPIRRSNANEPRPAPRAPLQPRQRARSGKPASSTTTTRNLKRANFLRVLLFLKTPSGENEKAYGRQKPKKPSGANDPKV